MKLLGLCVLAVLSAVAVGQDDDVAETSKDHFEVIQRTRSRLFQAHEHAKGLVDVAIEDRSQAMEKEAEIRRLLTEALRTHGHAEGAWRKEVDAAKMEAGEPAVEFSQYRNASKGAWSVKEILARMEDEGAIVLGEKAEALTDELRAVRTKLAEALSKATVHALESETLAKESPEKREERKKGMDNSFASTHKAYTLLRRATEIREDLEDTQDLIAETIKRETVARELVPAEDCPAHFLDSAERTGEVDDKLPVQQEFVCRALVSNELSHFEAVKETMKTEELKEAAEGVCAGVRRIYSLKRHADAPQRSCARIRVVVGEVVALARFRKYLKNYECDGAAPKNGTCNGNGVCRKSKCFCRPGWTSADCSIKTCAEGCSGNGFCNRGKCRCSAGWTGETCAIRDCPKHHGVRCGENGMCQRNNETQAFECLCAPGYKGLACEQPVCPFGEGAYKFECSGRGSCALNGQCKCFRGFGGSACGERKVKHGYCNKKGGCVCDKGYAGAACDLLECPLNCSDDNGVCDGFVGKCLCKRGWRGDGCQFVDPQCPLTASQKAEEKKMNATGLLSRPLHFKHCSARGLCKPVEEGETDGKCVCPPGWVGDSCQFEDCPGNGCSNGRRGVCKRDADGSNAKCHCFTGYGGEGCAEKLDVPVKCGQECFDSCLHTPGCKVDRAGGKQNRNAHLYTADRTRVEQEALESVLKIDLPPTAGVSSGKMNTCFMACSQQCVAERCWTRGAEFAKSKTDAEE